MNIIRNFWEALKSGAKNTVTTILGSGLALTALITALVAWTDGDPTTNPNWQLVIVEILGALGLIASRDANKTSEQSGAIKCELATPENTAK